MDAISADTASFLLRIAIAADLLILFYYNIEILSLGVLMRRLSALRARGRNGPWSKRPLAKASRA